jgi:DNA topoisomerase-6 subunit B
VWVPFTSEAKEAVAHYDELMKELKLAIQECGRKLGSHLRAREKALSDGRRLSLFQRYIPEVSDAISKIIGVPKGTIVQAFTDALPNFVNMVEEPPAADEGGSPPAAPSVPPPPDSVSPGAPDASRAGKAGQERGPKVAKSGDTSGTRDKVGKTGKKPAAAEPAPKGGKVGAGGTGTKKRGKAQLDLT